MLEKIINYYKLRDLNLPKKEIELISKHINFRTLKKKEFFFKEGDNNSSIAYVSRGCLRVFIKDHKKIEYNRYFAFEDWWVGEFHYILNNSPAKTSIQAIEQTELIEISSQGYQTILEECPVFTMATLKMHIANYAHLIEKEELKKTLTIEEQYIDLMENHPEIIKRVPLYHIASYLGVKPESLSRVKKKFKDNALEPSLG